MQFSNDDIAYVKTHFVCLRERLPDGPGPSYVLDDGSEYYPPDYYELERNEALFKARLRAAARAAGTVLDADHTWHVYLTGIYGVCLHSATPENIVRKNALLQRIDELMAAPRELDWSWISRLKHAVDALDAIERPFSPHYDRQRFGRPPSRDSHIHALRRLYPRIAQGAA